MTVLDVGAGFKANLTYRGEVNVDVNRPLKRIPNFIRADCHYLPIATGTVDTVYCYHLIEHVDSPLVTLQEICRVLKGNGKLLLATPNSMDLYNTLRTVLRGGYVPYFGDEAGRVRAHIQTWAYKELEAILHVAGFGAVEFRFVNHGRRRLVDPLLGRFKLSRTLEVTATK